MPFALTLALAAQAAEAPAVRAQASLADFIGTSDYPAAAQANGEQGTIAFQLSVTPDGRTTDCRVTASSGSASLDETTCRLMIERARFTPARDAAGNAVADVATARLNWVLPAAPPQVRARAQANLAGHISNSDYPIEAMRRGEQGRVGFELEISSEGRATNCHILSSSGSRLLDLRTCQIMLVRSRFEPARDAEGDPTSDTMSAAITWRLNQY